MDTKTFLSRVSAPQDALVVSLWKPDPTGQEPEGIFWNVGSFSDLDAAVAEIHKWDSQPDWTVYYSIGRMAGNTYQKPNGKTGHRRTQKHATWFKTLCFDMDIGDKYATQREGHTAVTAACRAIGMPTPLVVSSGRGIHYYWPLTSPITREEWETTSIALRLALTDNQVQIDTSKIHDPSMVLRPVGTHHKKQTPWRDVTALLDCPDYDHDQLRQILSNWVSKVPAKQTSKAASALSLAILRTCNVDIHSLAKKCQQVAALLASGGEFDAAGQPVAYPLWWASLGLAAHTPDPEAAIMQLCGAHPDFDLDQNLRKVAMWTAAPPTCATFERECPSGCNGCAHKGVTSPVSINEQVIAPPSTPTAVALATTAAPAREMPDGYYIQGNAIYRDVEREENSTDAQTGKKVKTIKLTKTLVCPYELHVLSLFRDVWGEQATGKSAAAAIISVRYPHEGEQEHELPLESVFAGGKEFATYLSSKQMILSTAALQEHTRTYIMRYMEKVQASRPSGIDFKRFGWQEDGSFLCGEDLIGSPKGNMMRRLKGTAKHYADLIRPQGDRETWCEATRLIDEPHAETFGVSLLTACIGVIGNASGAATPIVAFYSHESGTGKTLTLSMGSSAFMNPLGTKMFQPKDTDNALYHGLGTLGALSGAMDEMTMIGDNARAVDLAYVISMGREKGSLTRDRESRRPEEWEAPLRVSTNTSLYEMFETCMAQNAPARLRTLQFELHDRTFVAKHGTKLFYTLRDNYGFALPELAQAVISMGGRAKVWADGEAAFDKKYSFVFDSEERYFRNTIINCYIIGVIGKHLGLFRFDVNRVVKYMLDRVAALRVVATEKSSDAFDTLGQFMQENNNMIVVSRTEFGGKTAPVYPLPDKACIRIDIVWDAKNPVLPGSKISINSVALKTWLRKGRDSLDRLTTELRAMNALLDGNARVTMYKGCQTPNPGQAYCIVVDMTHPRFSSVLGATRPVSLVSPMRNVLQATP